MVITSKRGNKDNVVTFEHMCDTKEDMNNIDPRQINLGSVAIVLKGDSGIELYIATSEKEWILL